MNKILIALLAVAAVAYAYHEYREDDYGRRPVVTDVANHNAQMNECVRLALEKHPGAVVETEVEMEDGNLITDVDIQGADGLPDKNRSVYNDFIKNLEKSKISCIFVS